MTRFAALLLCLLSSCAAPAHRTHAGDAGDETGAVSRVLNARGPGDGLAFSDAMIVGDTLYLAGTLGLDPETGLAPESPEEEARLMLNAFRGRLEWAGLGMDDLVMVQVFCSDVQLYDRFNAVYREYFAQRFPTRAFIGSGTLLKGARFEINGIATRPR